MTDSIKILLIEDDELLSQGICRALEGGGYTPFRAYCTQEGERLYHIHQPDLILLDVGLHGEDGFAFCSRFRQEVDVPIIFLTALNDEGSIVHGLSLGADDYITKPFRVKELLARIEAVLRRCGGRGTLFFSGGLLLDVAHSTLEDEDGPIELTAVELKLLRQFLEHWPAIVTREQLLYRVWDKDRDFVDDNTLTVNILRLRKKLTVSIGENPIQTVRGVGYRWNPEVIRRNR